MLQVHQAHEPKRRPSVSLGLNISLSPSQRFSLVTKSNPACQLPSTLSRPKCSSTFSSSSKPQLPPTPIPPGPARLGHRPDPTRFWPPRWWTTASGSCRRRSFFARRSSIPGSRAGGGEPRRPVLSRARCAYGGGRMTGAHSGWVSCSRRAKRTAGQKGEPKSGSWWLRAAS